MDVDRPYGYKPFKKGTASTVPRLQPKNDRKELKMINLIILMLKLVKAILELLTIIIK